MKRKALAALVALALVTAACGDDDDTTADDPVEDTGGDTDGEDTDGEDTDGEDTDGEDGDEAAAGDFCADYAALIAGDPGPEEIREVAEIAPDDAKAPLETIAAGFETDPDGFFETPEFEEAFATLGDVAIGECADTELDVTAVDYGYEGVPEEIDAGVVGVRFVNDGAELHELLVLRKNDDTTESWEELLELDEEEAQSKVTDAGAAFALPGASSNGLLDLSEPGDYLAICFIPVGSTPDAGEEGGDGPPHFTQGMQVQFTVS